MATNEFLLTDDDWFAENRTPPTAEQKGAPDEPVEEGDAITHPDQEHNHPTTAAEPERRSALLKGS